MDLTLLILTDFFQAADRALAYASNLAGPLGAQQVLLNVSRDSVLDPELFTGHLSKQSRAAAKALHSLADNLPGPVTTEVGHGRVAYAVADAIRRHQPALVVLGRSNTEDTPDELVSTTALDLLRTAPQPMLVVPYTVQAARPPRRVLLAVDGEDFSLGEHTSPMRHLLNGLRAKVTVLHLTQEEKVEEAEAELLKIVRRLELTSGLTEPVRILSRAAPDAAEAIISAAQPTNFDLVIVIARPRSFLGQLFHRSVTAQVLLHSAVPVLVLPAQE
ncbi:universal stress protein [Hymenobacter lucidus]|uniref:Universal stress protein n=1 Tax=Hymenobacter lucidus TaxID=2880930 RepID=A0ABS8AR64_9BACT|nr:universal stress protein [Hymenobacter lucidus]MCB2408093.1 universal stress protein [Hymenobacter lucidus]